jgi:hypothetical protein
VADRGGSQSRARERLHEHDLDRSDHRREGRGQDTFPSIEIGDQSGTGTALHSHTLAFDRNGTPLPTENSPQRLFERLFVPDDAASREATLKRYAEKRSILDEVMGEAKSLEKKLGRADQTKALRIPRLRA